MNLERRWRRACRLVAGARDIIDERPQAEAPAWAIARGWVSFLSGLDEGAIAEAEARGLAATARPLGAPEDLCDLAAEIEAVCALPRLETADDGAPEHRVGARKRAQVAAFAAALAPRLAAASRIVDVGAGHGHLTRHLAAALRLEALGLERDPQRVATARTLAGGRARFEAVDLFAGPPGFRPDDLVVGLHACGALSDLLVQGVAEVGASAAFVSCCLQKRRDAARAPLVAGSPRGLTLPREVLGLGNVTTGAMGIEASRAANLRARARRAGLRALLLDRGLALGPGDEMRGVNRRRAVGPFAELVRLALARRGLPPATPAELAAAERMGREAQAAARRWSLARRMLGRPLEVYICLDRAVYLARRGYAAEVGTLWPAAISPRNIAVMARQLSAGGAA